MIAGSFFVPEIISWFMKNIINLSNNDKFLLQIDSERAIVITTGWEKAQEMKCRIISEVQAYG